MAGLAQVHEVDVDELAREKVQEIERLLDSSENHKPDSIDSWLSILKRIITAADLHRTNDKNANSENTKTKTETEESIYADYSDDNEQFNAVDLTEQFASNSVKWTIRVKAFKIVHRLVQMFSSPYRSTSAKSPVFKHLPDLVRLSFVAATSPYDDLKLQGFEMFKFLINRFASVEEKEFPGHSILEQYRTQVLSALKPAFNLDAPPYITAIASQVCCLWICRGLERELTDLRRAYQLMMGTIDKLENQSINQNSKLYTESELEQERLDILGAWAQLYITSKESDQSYLNESPTKTLNSTTIKSISEHLVELVKPHIDSLIDKWWEALKDYALLIMPAPKNIGTSHDNEHVYTREVALKLFAPVWPKLILASTIWLCSDASFELQKHSNESNGHTMPAEDIDNQANQICDNSTRNKTKAYKAKYFKFICGILMKEFCRCHLNPKDSLSEATIFSIRSLVYLVSSDEMKSALVDELAVAQEFYTVLYSVLINQAKSRTQHNLTLKNLLNSIFHLVMEKIATSPEKLRFSLAHLGDSIRKDLKAIEGAINDPDMNLELEPLKSVLFIRVSNMMCVLKLATFAVIDQVQLQESLIAIFQAIICFKADPSLGASYLDFLKGIRETLPKEIVPHFVEGLFNSKVAMASSLFNSIRAEQPQDKDKKLRLVSCLETYLKSMRTDINLSSPDDRHKLMAAYLKTILDKFPESLDKVTDKTNASSFSRKIELLDLGVRHIQDLKVAYPDEFKLVLCPEMKTILDTALKLREEIKTEGDTLRDARNVEKTPAAIKSARPQAKIVLKADFSNFYAKKP